jgi:hypothetical protein
MLASIIYDSPVRNLLMEGVAQCRIDGANTHYIC